MLPEYSHTEFESLAQISTSTAEIQNFFLGDRFLLAHPVHLYVRHTRFPREDFGVGVVECEPIHLSLIHI